LSAATLVDVARIYLFTKWGSPRRPKPILGFHFLPPSDFSCIFPYFCLSAPCVFAVFSIRNAAAENLNKTHLAHLHTYLFNAAKMEPPRVYLAFYYLLCLLINLVLEIVGALTLKAF